MRVVAIGVQLPSYFALDNVRRLASTCAFSAVFLFDDLLRLLSERFLSLYDLEQILSCVFFCRRSADPAFRVAKGQNSKARAPTSGWPDKVALVDTARGVFGDAFFSASGRSVSMPKDFDLLTCFLSYTSMLRECYTSHAGRLRDCECAEFLNV